MYVGVLVCLQPHLIHSQYTGTRQGRSTAAVAYIPRCAIAQFAKLSITIQSDELTSDVFARHTGHGLDLLLRYILIYSYDITCRGRSVQYKNQAGKRVLDHAGVTAPTRRYGLDLTDQAYVSPEVLDHFMWKSIACLICVNDFTRRDGDGKWAMSATGMF